MALKEGACRFGLWWVRAVWDGNTVHRVWFSASGEEGPFPPLLRSYLNGNVVDPGRLRSVATEESAPYSAIYRAVREVKYGSTATYGEIAEKTGTSARVVGNAMKRNPTPLIVPCHRIVSKNGIGGFTPDPEIKMALLRMENPKNEYIHLADRSCIQ